MRIGKTTKIVKAPERKTQKHDEKKTPRPEHAPIPVKIPEKVDA